MENAHRTNVLVTSCLKTPVDPQTKAPLASYERGRVLPYTAPGHVDNQHYEEELECEDSGSDFCNEEYLGQGSSVKINDLRASGDRFNLSEIFFSNEEYYSKLEELKKAHLHTMAELESMYRRKLELRTAEPAVITPLEARHRLQCAHSSQATSRCLRKSHSALELRIGSGQSDPSDEEADPASSYVEKGLFSPREHIKNMWLDFKLPPRGHQMSSSLNSLSGDQTRPAKRRSNRRRDHEDSDQESWKHRITIPKPFHMTLREAEKRKHRIKTRSEIEMENAELRRQLEELSECQRKFRASPVPAHVHLPLYEELQERNKERRRAIRNREANQFVQKPFSFMERERLKKEQKRQQNQSKPEQEKVKPFKAKAMPKSVYAAASGEHMREEQLYRSIKMQMRAQEMLLNASMPPSMLARRLRERKMAKDAGDNDFSHRPQINKEVPDFDASYRRFKKHLERRKEVKATTACEPFNLKTSLVPSHRERILADIEKDQNTLCAWRWPYIGPEPLRTPNSSLCSSLSGSLELLPAKTTDATKKRHEAVRKVLEQRRKTEEEQQQWKERQKHKEKKLQGVVLLRAQAHDPHLALSETNETKLKEFRKQDIQRRKEYQQEIKEMKQRVKRRPLLLEQVAQRNAKQAAEKRYTDALHGCDVTQEFITSKGGKSASAHRTSPSSDSKQSDQDDADMEYKPVHFRKVFLDEDGVEADPDERHEDASSRCSDEDERDDDHHDYHNHDDHDSYRYSDDHENYSGESEREGDSGQQETEE